MLDPQPVIDTIKSPASASRSTSCPRPFTPRTPSCSDFAPSSSTSGPSATLSQSAGEVWPLGNVAVLPAVAALLVLAATLTRQLLPLMKPEEAPQLFTPGPYSRDRRAWPALGGLAAEAEGRSVWCILSSLRSAFHRWRMARRQYAIERAIYKAGGGGGARHGGATGGAERLTGGTANSQIANAAKRGIDDRS